MNDLLAWLATYSPPVVALIAVGAVGAFLVKLIVEKAIARTFDEKTKRFETLFQRRSAFEEMILIERFELMSSLDARLQRIMTNLNRARSGHPVPDGFLTDGELVPLTEVFEDIEIGRLKLGEDLRNRMESLAQAALTASNAADENEWKHAAEEWIQLRKELREQVEADFGLTSIKW